MAISASRSLPHQQLSYVPLVYYLLLVTFVLSCFFVSDKLRHVVERVAVMYTFQLVCFYICHWGYFRCF